MWVDVDDELPIDNGAPQGHYWVFVMREVQALQSAVGIVTVNLGHKLLILKLDQYWKTARCRHLHLYDHRHPQFLPTFGRDCAHTPTAEPHWSRYIPGGYSPSRCIPWHGKPMMYAILAVAGCAIMFFGYDASVRCGYLKRGSSVLSG